MAPRRWQISDQRRRADHAADADGARDLLLHLDLERVPDPAGDAGLQRQPDGLGGDGPDTGQNVSDPTLQAAAALLGIAPTVIFFLIFQRTLTRGVVAGAVK